jgi:hypothetical protein
LSTTDSRHPSAAPPYNTSPYPHLNITSPLVCQSSECHSSKRLSEQKYPYIYATRRQLNVIYPAHYTTSWFATVTAIGGVNKSQSYLLHNTPIFSLYPHIMSYIFLSTWRTNRRTASGWCNKDGTFSL